MVDSPNVPRVPHIFGVTLDSSGVDYTQVVAINRTTGKRQIKETDGNQVVIFDAADFTLGYSVNDVIEFQNVGASVGGTTATITNATGGFQAVTLTATAAPTVSVNL